MAGDAMTDTWATVWGRVRAAMTSAATVGPPWGRGAVWGRVVVGGCGGGVVGGVADTCATGSCIPAGLLA